VSLRDTSKRERRRVYSLFGVVARFSVFVEKDLYKSRFAVYNRREEI
jgi:hypothetical protein